MKRTLHDVKRELMRKLGAEPNHWTGAEVIQQIRSYAAYRLFLAGESFEAIARDYRVNQPWTAADIERRVRAHAARVQKRTRG